MLELPTPPTDWARLTLVYLHLLACVSALALVARADLRLLTNDFTIEGLRRAAHRTSFALVALWATGLALVHIDTGLIPAVVLGQPKLVLKLVVVTVLTLNGIVLHAVSFPILSRRRRPGFPRSVLLAVTGALSTGHWLLAAFVGVARPLGQWSLEPLLLGYAAFCATTLCAAVLCAPVLRRRLFRRRRSSSARRVESRPSQDAPSPTPRGREDRAVRTTRRRTSRVPARPVAMPGEAFAERVS